MDILSHGLWSAAVGQGVNLKKKGKPLNLWFFSFMGMFPDLFAFTPIFLVTIYDAMFSGRGFTRFDPNAIEGQQIWRHTDLSALTEHLYSLSHSLIIFAVAFGAASLIFRRPLWELLGWMLHIISDIPTHGIHFYPTPFLWPLSNVRVNGYSWTHTNFLIGDFALLAVTYLVLWRLRKKKTPRRGVSG